MSQNSGDGSRDELILDYLENETTPAEEKEFRRLLNDESFRNRVAGYAIDLGHLSDQARQGMLHRTLVARTMPVQRRRRRDLAIAVATTASVFLAGTAIWWTLRAVDSPNEVAQHNDTGIVPAPSTPPSVSQSPEKTPDKPPSLARTAVPGHRAVIARVDQVSGQVLLGTSPESQHRAKVGNERVVRSGDVLQAVGPASFAVLRFDDGSVIATTGGTEVTCAVVDSQKCLVVHRGDILAQVAPQPKKPMIIKTPAAEVEVIGTRLSLFANMVLTELAVLEGHAILRRLSDNRTIDVRRGQCAMASSSSHLAAELIAPAASIWEEDFEKEWPERWRAGHWIHDELPAGSNGAALAAPLEEEGPCFISTPNMWVRGLFRIEDDTHLNLTYKLRRPGWFYVMLETRSEDYTGDYRGHYMFQTPEIWQIPRDEWRTVSIPLAEFHEPLHGRSADTPLPPPEMGTVVFSLLLRTQLPDPGLGVDRIWVTQGAPESAKVMRTND